jgi:hypothetical protein
VSTASVSPTPVVQNSSATATGETKYGAPAAFVSGGDLSLHQHPAKNCSNPFDFSGLGPALISEDPTDGTASAAADTSVAGTFALHAVYQGKGSGFGNSTSPCVDLVVNPSDQSCPANGLLISATRASGNGTPLPACSSNWSFRITINNCSGQNISRVTAQGGTTGWADLTSPIFTPTQGIATIRKSNNKNEVIFWDLGPLAAGQTASLDIPLSGKANKPAGTVMYLSGPWSALNYDVPDPITLTPPYKSDYTGRVSLTTTSAANGGTCP